MRSGNTISVTKQINIVFVDRQLGPEGGGGGGGGTRLPRHLGPG